MIRFLFRFLGLWLLAGAFVALVIDGTRSIAASRIVLTPLVEAWVAIHPPSIERLHDALRDALPPWAWENIAVNILYAPLWLVLAVLGTMFVLLGRRRARPIGYSSRD